VEFGSDSDADVVLLDRFDRGFFIYIGFFREKLSNFAKGQPAGNRQKAPCLAGIGKGCLPRREGAPPWDRFAAFAGESDGGNGSLPKMPERISGRKPPGRRDQDNVSPAASACRGAAKIPRGAGS